MTREEAEILLANLWQPGTAKDSVKNTIDLWAKLGMLKLDNDFPPEKVAMCRAFSNYENTYRPRGYRSETPEREAMLVWQELERLGFKVVKA